MDAWFRTRETERDGMPLELLERDEVLASVMPGRPGQPGEPGSPGGDEASPDETEEDVPAEQVPSGDGA
ncbi:MAG TPA: hypothetical protein VGC72_03910 [Candidatus Elarobacter sp.]|jgi:hypothetical protein